MPGSRPFHGRLPFHGRELIVVTGAIDSGKTSWCSSFSDAHRDFDGLLLRKVFQGDRRIGYDAVRLCSRAIIPFSRLKREEPPGWHAAEAVGPFTISEEGRQAANRWLLEALDSEARGLMIDEIGPLEIGGGGLAKAVRRVLEDRIPRPLVLVVRRDCLVRAIAAFGLPDHRLVEVDAPDHKTPSGVPGP